MMTPRQKQVYDLVLKGLGNSEIGELLGITESAVKSMTSTILRKHGVPTKLKLLAKVLEGK